MIKRLRVNYQNRIWLAVPSTPTRKIKKETILTIKNSSGDIQDIFAEDCKIFKQYR